MVHVDLEEAEELARQLILDNWLARRSLLPLGHLVECFDGEAEGDSDCIYFRQ